MHKQLRELTLDVNEASDLELTESIDNSHKNWLVATIRAEDRDATEHVSNIAKRHGFDLCWVDFESQEICLNRKAEHRIVDVLRNLNGTTEVSQNNDGVLVTFVQDPLEETIACILSLAKGEDFTVTHYTGKKDSDEKLMRLQYDPDGELDSWKDR